MTQTPAGWYPDPSIPPGAPGAGLRWWDGQRWTEHAALLAGHGQQQVVIGKATTTPDGQPLAGWGARVGAFLIDGLILTALGVVAGFPFYRRLISGYLDFFHRIEDAANSGAPQPSQIDLYRDNFGALLGIFLVVSWIPLVGSIIGLYDRLAVQRWPATSGAGTPPVRR